MRTLLAVVLLVGAGVVVTACADSTSPNGFCQITSPSGQIVCN
jgi:hypothetical protein